MDKQILILHGGTAFAVFITAVLELGVDPVLHADVAATVFDRLVDRRGGGRVRGVGDPGGIPAGVGRLPPHHVERYTADNKRW